MTFVPGWQQPVLTACLEVIQSPVGQLLRRSAALNYDLVNKVNLSRLHQHVQLLHMKAGLK